MASVGTALPSALGKGRGGCGGGGLASGPRLESPHEAVTGSDEARWPAVGGGCPQGRGAASC